MAVTSTPFNRFRYLLGTGKINFTTDAFKMMLVPVGFVQNIDTQGALADLTAGNAPITTNIGGTAVGGAMAMANQTFTESDSTDRAVFVTDTVEFTASGAVNAIGAIIYDDTVTAPDADALMTYIAFGETKTLASGEKLQITCPAGGWVTI